MSRSRRLGAATALPAVVLAAALVLTPATAFAADGDPVAAEATTDATTGTTTTGDSTSVSAVAVPGDASPAAAEPAGPGAQAVAPATLPTDVPDATGSSEDASDAAAPEVDAPVETSAPTREVAPTEVATDMVVDDLFVFIPVNAAHPGQAFPVFAQGFTPGDVVGVTVSGEGVPADADYVTFDDSPVFDEDGSTVFFVELPATFAVGGFVTVTVTDGSGLSSSSDVPVTTSVPAPALTAPVGATAGVVTVNGQNGVPGGYALVEVYDADELVTDLPDPSTDAPSDADPSAEPDPASDAEPTGDEIAFEIPVDVDPVPYEVSGSATAVVPVDADGRFAARFVLPVGDFATDAYTFDADLTTESDFSAAVVFSVASAATVPVTTTPSTVAPAALPVRRVAAVTPTRATSLAYTGSEPSGALTWALGAVLAGAGALVAGRLRLRRR
ncbi:MULTISPECIES: hypothetical protein [unclassified Frigoribacterium]|uniref:hypothetical protein n=1 Tax=unclassified Frigoribacterium TaxID=2627005 RepID=UPI0006FAD8D1|nr:MULTISPECIES: hypothetical protein [unclassified Frigoribacterium]KQO46222.1 hypothetical protein ASF07_00050 [Frigoribacterium sp. Leaf254]KQT38313.1 hypothetical protein ASG28_00050 [Frigoribacterium sp. Leaf415]